MFMKIFSLSIFLLLEFTFSTNLTGEFTFNGFNQANLTLDGSAYIQSNGLLQLTYTPQTKGHAFLPMPVHFGNTISSFSTTFVFAIVSAYADLSGHGIAFLISPTTNLSSALPSQYMGLFNIQNNGNSTNHIFAVELDTIYSSEFQDINDNHVGIDINSLKSSQSHTAGYYDDKSGSFQNLTLMSHKKMQAWVEYDSQEKRIDVTLSPIGMSKPSKPLLSYDFNLSTVLINNSMYIGFSSSTGTVHTSHYILGWSFMLNGVAPSIDLSKLPKVPTSIVKGRSKIPQIVLPIASASSVLMLVVLVFLYMKSWFKYAELREDWEDEFGPHRFTYKDLHQATNGFKEKELLGTGGFGRVYRGVLPVSKLEVAVKKVSHESRDGTKQFIAEVVSIGQLRHRNLVQLLGYCRRKKELLLVYDYMPNGSLDKYLYSQEKPALNWTQRFNIIKGVASSLLYLHEESEQVVVHRDVKASNVLLDSELNGRLGDFGLARLYDHGTDPQTTHVVGTMGYLSPELVRSGKATPLTDVFAFGAFILEVVCARRPIESGAQGDQIILVDLVIQHWQSGLLPDIADPRLGEWYETEELEMVLKLGLLCSHPVPTAQPSMRQVMQYLDGDAPLPDLSTTYMSFNMLGMLQNEGLDSYVMPYLTTTTSFSSVLSGR
ncbi:Concanavalin A-like lectin protein kinase family protein [Rhynchospora pubera]|uniref:non-specific serine/threonine protein kinase n=1 Tax=Rhynchospora pubera TaxID=906938 RepID=A0AAV8EWR3_9POAL|nr:Concanavalin A-like lectin protein kinase family protein [Rhynchospora pubera]